MKIAKTILCIVALILIAQPVAAHRQLLAHAWEFRPQRCNSIPSNSKLSQELKRQLICSDPDLRAAAIDLSNAYQEKIAQLEPALTDALRSDSNVWWRVVCFGPEPFDLRRYREIARACLKQKLALRRQFVLAIATDRPKAAYLFSQSELGLLRNTSVRSTGLISQNVSGYDPLTLGVRRVLAAVLPHKPEPQYSISDSLSDFSANAYLRDAYDDSLHLEDGRYLVDYGTNPPNDEVQGMFVVDLETGETSVAFVDDDEPVLLIWQKACASSSFQNESYTLFQKYVPKVLTGSWRRASPSGDVDSRIYSTPCN